MGAPLTTACSGASAAESTPRRCRAAISGRKGCAGAQPFFRSLGDDGDRGGVIGGGELLRDARFSLGRGERALDLVDAGGEGGEIGAGGVRLLRLGLELRDPRREVRNRAALGVDVGAQVLVLRRQTLGRVAARRSVPGAGRLQRRHPLLEIRCV